MTAGARRLGEGDVFAIALHVFLHLYRIRALRHDRAGHNAHAFALCQRAAKGFAGNGLPHHAQLLPRVCGKGITIHGGHIRSRHGNRGNDRFRQHPPDGSVQRHFFRARDRSKCGADLRFQLVKGEHAVFP